MHDINYLSVKAMVHDLISSYRTTLLDIVNAISSTCAFLTMTSENVCCEIGLFTVASLRLTSEGNYKPVPMCDVTSNPTTRPHLTNGKIYYMTLFYVQLASSLFLMC